MKKIFLIGLAAAALLTGCNQDETLEMAKKDGAISFAPYAGKSTRTLVIENVGHLPNFYVYGWKTTTNGENVISYNIFDKQIVTRSGDGDYIQWKYNPLQYWEEGYAYQFEAIYPEPDGTNLTFDKNKEGSKIFFKNDGTQDLIYARPGEITYDNDNSNNKVNLSFKHLLSRIRFRIENSFSGNSTVKVRVNSIELRNCGKLGTISPEIGNDGKIATTWVMDSGAGTQTILVDKTKSPDNGLTNGSEISSVLIPVNNGTNNNRLDTEAKFVFPGLGGERKIYIDYDVIQTNNNGDEDETTTTNYTKEINFTALQGDGLVMSTAYAILIKIGAGTTSLNPIDFSVVIDPWNVNYDNVLNWE